MPIETVSLTPTVASPSSAVREAVDALSFESRAMSATVAADGGVTVSAVLDVLQPTVVRLGFTTSRGSTFAPAAIHAVSVERRVALSVHGGRALTNNGVLASVLAAAAHPDIDWLVVVLPERYKKGATLPGVRAQLDELSDASGIRLDLVGVTLIGFNSASGT